MNDKKVSLTTAIALVVANMVGTGVFTSLGFQAEAIPSVSILLFLWFCGGLIALCGGLSYIQLAKIFPGSGGEYHYIKQSYPPVFSYLAGFISVFAGFAAPVALAAMAFSMYFLQLFPNISVKWVAILLVSGVTLFHCFSLHLASRFQLITTAVKIFLILLFIIFGLFYSGTANAVTFSLNNLHLVTNKSFAVSLVYVSFAYSGWNACIYIFDEIKNPQVNIKKSIIIGTALVTFLYILLNFVFLKTVPIKQLSNVVEVGALAATAIFGIAGGKIIALFISLILISSISAMVWVGARVVNKMMLDFKTTSKIAAKSDIPLIAIGIVYTITILLILTETFQKILIYTGVMLSVSSCLAVLALYFNYRKISFKHLIAPTVFLLANIYTITVLLKSVFLK